MQILFALVISLDQALIKYSNTKKGTTETAEKDNEREDRISCFHSDHLRSRTLVT